MAVEDVAPVYTFIGRVEVIHSVKVVPRVTAFIDSAPVQQGSEVKAGQVLFQLQKAQYEAAVQSAQAQLLSAQAGLRQAQLAYERASQLNARGFEAQAKLDQAIATRDQDKAAVPHGPGKSGAGAAQPRLLHDHLADRRANWNRHLD